MKPKLDYQVVEQVVDVPARPADAHKGTFGTVMVVGGSATMMGAPALCGAALRAGSGLVKIAAPVEALAAAITIEPGATGVAVTDDVAMACEAINEVDPTQAAILAVGPGMGVGPAQMRLVEALLACARPIVLDADGLNNLARLGHPPERRGAPPLILTPHPGEFRRLAGALQIARDPVDPAQRQLAAVELAQHCGAVVVLKGRHTVVSDGQRVYVNTTGNPALATAGSGDVLTGLTASLLGQGLGAFDAATLATYLHGLAADIWAEQFGPSGLTARDLCQYLPRAFHHHRKQRG